MLPGIRAQRDLVERLDLAVEALEITKSEAIRRALEMFLGAPADEQQRSTEMEALVRRIVDERLAQRDKTDGDVAA